MSSTQWKAIPLATALMLCATAHAQTPRDRIVPLLDAHQHIMSPAATALVAPPPSPPGVDVPAPLAALLRAREAVDTGAYASVFTDDALVFAEEHGRWWLGEDRILDAIGNFPSDRRFIPVRHAADGTTGFIAGLLRDPGGQDTHDFMLGLRKGADGRWRIASEMKQRIMPPLYAPSITAGHVIAMLDDAGIRQATVLSVAYWFGKPGREHDAPEAHTRAENDWTIAETGKVPDRLIPFCGVNPLADYAIAELERCAAIPRVRGMKVHRNSRFDFTDPVHVDKLRRFFRAANEHQLAIVIHLRGSAEPFIDRILPAAPDVPVQIAHMGSGWDNAKLFADAIEAKKPGTRHLWFDWTQALPIEGLWGYGPSENLGGTVTAEEKADIVATMRRLGLDRILYGSDMPLAWNPTPRDWWRKTILTLPLTDDEVRNIADNLPPYARGGRDVGK